MNLTIRHGLLDLSDKGLKDLSILKEVENPHTCKKLKLNNNYEISLIENIKQFENLEELNLGRNKIKKIENIGNLSNLKELFLYGNQIEVIENLDALKNLNKLILDINHIREIDGLSNLEKLETISLGKNKITRISGAESLNSLKKMNLDGNPIQEITSIGNLKNLIELRIHNNNLNPDLLNMIGGVSSNGVVQNIEKLKAYCRNEFVKVNGNIIFAEIFPEFGGLGLNLACKEIVDIKSIKNLDNIHNLKGLYLFRNKIKEINGLESLTELEHLDLSFNEITSIRGLESLKNLRFLKLNTNNITKIENLEQLNKLQVLKLNNNEIKEISNLDALKNLKTLDLGNNQISIIKRLNHLEHLEKLLLPDNNLNRIENLNSLKKLERLNLSSNNIRKIEGLELLTNLFRLYLSKNSVEVIEGLHRINTLIELDLSANQIIKVNGIENLTNLEVLNLDRNDLIQEIITQIRNISNVNTFSKYCVGFCLLRKILTALNENQEEIINFENSYQEFQFLLRFKYSQIQAIEKLLTDQYLEYQVGRNHFIISIFTPNYFANELDKLLEKIEPKESYRYEHLANELKLKNKECTINLIKYVEEHKLNKIPFTRKLYKIIRRKGDNEYSEVILEMQIKRIKETICNKIDEDIRSKRQFNAVLDNLLTIYGSHQEIPLFKTGEDIDEEDFHNEVYRRLYSNLGSKVENHKKVGKGDIDFLVYNYPVDVKVEDKVQELDKIYEIHKDQVAYYCYNRKEDVGFLFIYDNTEKTKDYSTKDFGVFEEKEYKIVVLLLRGNFPYPSIIKHKKSRS